MLHDISMNVMLPHAADVNDLECVTELDGARFGSLHTRQVLPGYPDLQVTRGIVN